MYLQYSDSLSVTYGSLGAVIVLLLCFYLSGIELLSRGILNVVLENLAAANEKRRGNPCQPRKQLNFDTFNEPILFRTPFRTLCAAVAESDAPA